MALGLSFCLMIADHHFHRLDYIRAMCTVLVAPIQYAVDYPVRIIGGVQALLTAKTALINENIQLRYKQTLLEAQLQKLLAIRNENLHLRELLSASSHANARTMAAQILAVDAGNARQILVINKGKRDGIFTGQPVLDAKGVVGQIIDVGIMTSTVLLISDGQSAVPVRNSRTGEHSILVGSNNISQLSLVNLSKTSPILVGDILVTSGLGRRYPEGYPVGQVAKVIDTPGDEFIRAEVRPIALLNRNRLVLLIWPETGHEQLTAQINERINALDEHA